MEVKAAIYYRNAYAHYRITREYKRVYHADLVFYDGDGTQTPPKSILMLRGIKTWWGSADDRELIKNLGEVITSLSESDQYFTDKQNSTDTMDIA